MHEQVLRAATRVPAGAKWARMIFGVALLAVFVPGAVQARTAERSRSQNAQLVHVANGLLTIDVHEASLRKLLEEVARQSGLTVEGQASIAEWITVQFQEIRLEEGLRLLLDDQSYALEYSLLTRGEGNIARVPTRLWIFRKGGGSRASSGSVGHEAQANLGNVSIDLPRLRAVLEGADDDRWDKWDAIEALAESEHAEAALPLLRFALAARGKSRSY